MSTVLEQSLDALAASLAEERRAILEHDVQALVRSTQGKLDSLRRIEQSVQDTASPDLQARLLELSQGNLANGALLARRRREVNWTLRHLGRSEASGAYDVKGQTTTLASTRALGVV